MTKKITKPTSSEIKKQKNKFDAKDYPDLQQLTKKWSMLIIKDIFFGNHRFSDFLDKNPDLSSKVLSEQLRSLEKTGFIEKKIITVTPLKVEYILTQKGRDLNRLLYELMIFAKKHSCHLKKYDSVTDSEFRKIFGIT
jgi:DNA-binding HxlR family transcriptional regulator